jgi:hypothetical protein
VAPATWCIFDPPYLNCDVRAYKDSTLDHREMVGILLRAKFRWVLSEYENKEDHGLYRALGEPIRIPVLKALNHGHNGWAKRLATECLWMNFEPPMLQSVNHERNHMPKVDTAELLLSLQKERDDIDAAIRALNRTVQRNFAPGSKATSPASSPKKKGHKWSPAKRAEMSRKLKEAWKKRKGKG